MFMFGVKGKRGDDGAAGEQGVDGADGVQGEQGIQGIQGIQGEQGEQASPFASQFSVCRSSEQTISRTTLTKIQFNYEYYDNNSEFDKDTHYRWTPNEAGIYTVGSYVILVGLGDGKYCKLNLMKLPATYVLLDEPKIGRFGNSVLSIGGDIKVEQGDAFDVAIYHDDATSKQILTMYKCRFWGHRIA